MALHRFLPYIRYAILLFVQGLSIFEVLRFVRALRQLTTSRTGATFRWI